MIEIIQTLPFRNPSGFYAFILSIILIISLSIITEKYTSKYKTTNRIKWFYVFCSIGFTIAFNGPSVYLQADNAQADAFTLSKFMIALASMTTTMIIWPVIWAFLIRWFVWVPDVRNRLIFESVLTITLAMFILFILEFIRWRLVQRTKENRREIR
jgi:hypothetical protein